MNQTWRPACRTPGDRRTIHLASALTQGIADLATRTVNQHRAFPALRNRKVAFVWLRFHTTLRSTVDQGECSRGAVAGARTGMVTRRKKPSGHPVKPDCHQDMAKRQFGELTCLACTRFKFCGRSERVQLRRRENVKKQTLLRMLTCKHTGGIGKNRATKRMINTGLDEQS